MSDTSNTSRSTQRVSSPELFDGFRHLADFSQDAIYHYDIESRRFLFHNRTFRKFFRIEDKTEITATADQIIKTIHPEDRQSVRKTLKQSLIAGQKAGEAPVSGFSSPARRFSNTGAR
jgi:hypothetical protein